MGNTVGYMVTWTTYGTWLQGDKRGYVKDGEVVKKNEQLRRDNERKLVNNAVRLGWKEKKVVGTAIRNEAEKYGIGLEALASVMRPVGETKVTCQGLRVEEKRDERAGVLEG